MHADKRLLKAVLCWQGNCITLYLFDHTYLLFNDSLVHFVYRMSYRQNNT